MSKNALLLSLALTSASFADFRQEQSPTSLKLYLNDQLITEYHTDHDLPYLYPLVGPNGTSITRHYPMKKDLPGEANDHPHHRSFWFAHGDVNGHDFWHSPNHKARITHQSFGPSEKGTFTANLHWQVEDEVLLAEQRTYQFAQLPDSALMITITCQLTAKTDVTFGDTKEGSFALRVAPTLRLKGEVAKGQILSSEGKTNENAWGTRARWMTYHGPDVKGQPVVLTMMDHPKNLNHPTHWHARDYGLLTANPWGEKSFTKKGSGKFTLAKNQTLTQTYALLLQIGPLAKESINHAYQNFSK